MAKKINFEEKIEKSKKLLEKLMDPEITLEESIKVYKEGKKELQEASKLLENAKLVFKECNSNDQNSVFNEKS
jgi:exodeoxyribonuclease VII small subunit